MPLSYHGVFKGILIVNYFMQPLLDNLVNAPLYNMILADGNGEVLVHYNPDRNWSRFTGKASLAADIPNLQEVLGSDIYRGPTFFARQLHLPLEQKLVLILSLNDHYLSFQQSLSNNRLMYSSVITLIITTIFGLIFALLLNKFFVDYTNRGQYIDELTSLNKRISNLLLKNKVYMEMASDGIHILDNDGNVVAFSHAFADMLGYTDKEASQLNIRDWDVVIPEDKIRATMASFTREPRKFETRHRRKDGSIIDVEVNGKWITTPDGEFFYASYRDITERKQMEKELQSLATTDSLTQLFTRRAFIDHLTD